MAVWLSRRIVLTQSPGDPCADERRIAQKNVLTRGEGFAIKVDLHARERSRDPKDASLDTGHGASRRASFSLGRLCFWGSQTSEKRGEY